MFALCMREGFITVTVVDAVITYSCTWRGDTGYRRAVWKPNEDTMLLWAGQTYIAEIPAKLAVALPYLLQGIYPKGLKA